MKCENTLFLIECKATRTMAMCLQIVSQHHSFHVTFVTVYCDSRPHIDHLLNPILLERFWLVLLYTWYCHESWQTSPVTVYFYIFASNEMMKQIGEGWRRSLQWSEMDHQQLEILTSWFINWTIITLNGEDLSWHLCVHCTVWFSVITWIVSAVCLVILVNHVYFAKSKEMTCVYQKCCWWWIRRKVISSTPQKSD